MKSLEVAVLMLSCLSWTLHPNVQADGGLLSRRYQEGEELVYIMKGFNDGLRYSIRSTGIVKQDPEGGYLEEFSWSDLSMDGVETRLTEDSLRFRQILSLDPERLTSIPQLNKVQPMLIGPILDFMNFYVDLWWAVRLDQLNHEGDHVYVEAGFPASWADGNRVLTGTSSVDFDLTLTATDEAHKTATLLVRHVPPKGPQLKLPATWMKEPVADTPNNWVQVSKKNGKYTAEVGKETFDVELKISLVDGRILSGTMDNRFKTLQSVCDDDDLTKWGDPRTHEIVRRIEISLER